MFRRETQRFEADLREWKGRDASVAASVVAIQGSGRLLGEMEMQARSGLDQEVKKTRDQRVQMEGSVMGAKLQARQVEEKMMGIEEFAQVKELERMVSRRRQELEEKKRQSGRTGSRGDQLKGDRNQWDLFKKVVLDTAKAWKSKELATKAATEEGEALNEMNRRVKRMREAAAARQQEVRSEQVDMMRKTEQEEEIRRRTEQEGRARLEKVSSELGRMERVLGCRTNYQGGDVVMESQRGPAEASCLERSLGEERVKEYNNGDIQRKAGTALHVQTVGRDCSQVQRGDMGTREHCFSSTSTSSLSNYIPPTPRTLKLQLSLSTSLLKRSPSSHQVAAELDASKVAAVVPPQVQADWSLQQRQCPLAGERGKQESPGMNGGGDQQQRPTPRLLRLPLPKLALVRPKSTPEQRVESGSRTDLEGSPSQRLQKIDQYHTPSKTSSFSTMSTMFEQEKRSSIGTPCTHAASENKSVNDKLSCKSVPKLNLITCNGSGLFKMSKEKDFVDGQPKLRAVSDNVGCDSNQQVRIQQRSQGGLSDVVSLRLNDKLEGTPSEREQSVREEEDHADVPQSNVHNQQDRATVTTEAAVQQDPKKIADQDCGKESDLEEGEFFDADCNEADAVVEGGNDVEEAHLEVEEGELSEASLLPTSASASPRITPGKRRLPPLKLSPGTALNDSKREAALKDLMAGISQEQEESAVPSLPKAPRLQLSLSTNTSEGKSLKESPASPKNRTDESISFNIADLEQGGPKQVATPPDAGSSAMRERKEPSSPIKDLFGGGDTGFGFIFGADDSCETERSFSFFGGGGCKSPDKGEKEGTFFLNFGGGDEKMEEESAWNFFGQ